MGERSDGEDSDIEIISSTPGTISLNRRSTRRCKDRKLSSSTYETFFEHMWKNIAEKKRAPCTNFESIWFSMYLNSSYKEKVLAWIKKLDIFSKRYVFVPIVCWGHWRLLIFCNFGEKLESKTKTPCMLLLDSLKGADPRQIEPDTRKLVLDIFRAEKRQEADELINKIPLLVPKVPQQTDGEECGFFVLYFIYLFAEKAPKSFNMSKGYPYFMQENWFTHDNLEDFRKQFTQEETSVQ